MVEADESDRSFLKLARDVAVVTNVELDHHATYRSLADLERRLRGVRGSPREVRICHEDVELPGDARCATAIGRAATCAPAGVELLPLGSRFEVERRAASSCACPGAHNVLNALGARSPLPRGRRAAREAAPRAARRSPAPAGASRRTGARRAGRARVRRLRPPPDRGARHARGRARRSSRERLVAVLPAAPLLAHAAARARVRRGAGAGRRRWWCSTSTRRASAPRTSRA